MIYVDSRDKVRLPGQQRSGNAPPRVKLLAFYAANHIMFVLLGNGPSGEKDMPIHLHCLKCRVPMDVDIPLLGGIFPCPSCGEKVQVLLVQPRPSLDEVTAAWPQLPLDVQAGILRAVRKVTSTVRPVGSPTGSSASGSGG